MRRLLIAALLLASACVHAGAQAHDSTFPTPQEANAFVADVDQNVRRLWVARDRAAWVNENFLTEDTDALAAAGEAATAEYMGRAIPASRRFARLRLAPDVQRQLYLLSISQTVPAPADAALREELAGLEAAMQSSYGKAEACLPGAPKAKGKSGTPLPLSGGVGCLKLDELSKLLAKSRDYDTLVSAWTGWHDAAAPMKSKFERYVVLGNEGAKAIGYPDLGALWRSGYDMKPEEFAAEEEKLWQQVKPLYDELHCYVRKKLRDKYGAEHVPVHGAIPVPLLGNMWGQTWDNIYDLVAPYPKQPSIDADAQIKKHNLAPQDMVKLGEKFFLSLGFPPLPETFWSRSLFTRPKDREVVCHASAWDVTWSDDLRIKMCIEQTEEDLRTIHHELGHDFYFQSYTTQPILFQQGANDGFHEGIGDTLALSVTPAYLNSLGLLNKVADNDQARLNHLMKIALEKIAFLPFGYVVDKWRWDVFSGKVDAAHYNQAWWADRLQYQGEAPPAARPDTGFDPGAKYHVASSTPYARYFLAAIYQFQFHRALCKVAGHEGPLDDCSIYGSKAAGERLRSMLALGASKPWQDALAQLSGERDADATAILDYFAPLRTWLDGQVKGEACGW